MSGKYDIETVNLGDLLIFCLALLFICLKPFQGTEVAIWSWIWVLLPIWIIPTFSIGFMVGLAAVSFILTILKKN